MKKTARRLLSMLIVAAMALSMLSMISFAAGTTTTVYCQTPDSWTVCKIHWWGSADTADTTWPGVDMTKDANGIWAIEVPSDADGLVIHNGSGIQSADLQVPTDSNNMFVYANGTWAPYGEVYVEPAPLYTVYCEAPDVWTSCNVYWWGSVTRDNPEWPGVPMTKDGNLWTSTVPADAAGVVFSNDLGVQSDDMSPPVGDGQLYTLEAIRYYVAGDFNEWVENDEAFLMDLQEDGSYTLTMTLEAGVYGLKVTDGTWENSWGLSQHTEYYSYFYNYMINVVEEGQVTVIFEPSTETVSAIGDCLGVYSPGPTVAVEIDIQDYAIGAYVHWWGSSTCEDTEWPGVAMTQNEEGNWCYDVPSDAEGMVFNWGPLKSFDVPVPPYDAYFAFGEPTLYVVGDFNDWTNSDAYELTSLGDGAFELTFPIQAGSHELRISGIDSSTDWSSIYPFEASADTEITVTYDYMTHVVTIQGDGVEVFDSVSDPDPEPLVIESLHAVGMAGLMGVGWDPSANEMNEVDGVYFITFENIAAGTYEYKFAANGTWDLNWTSACSTESGTVYDLLFNTPLNNTLTVTEDNSTVTLFVDVNDMDLTTGEGACCMAVVEPPVTGVTVSGSFTTGTEGDTTIELMQDGEVFAGEFLEGKTGSYSLENIPAGTYTLVVSKENHATREYELVVGDQNVTLDVKIHLIGDITGDGRINVGDVSRIYAYTKKSGTLTDYEFACADVTGDGRVNVGDCSRVYGHSKKTSSLW